jgi:hypothetical protein
VNCLTFFSSQPAVALELKIDAIFYYAKLFHFSLAETPGGGYEARWFFLCMAAVYGCRCKGYVGIVSAKSI